MESSNSCSTGSDSSEKYDGFAKEAALRAAAEGWDTSHRLAAQPGDVPVLDVGNFLQNSNAENETSSLVDALRDACENVGMYALIGHGIDTDAFLQTACDFHALPADVKQALAEENGMGYLPLNHQKLPTRSTSGNANESFVVKRHLSQQSAIDWCDNPCWPSDAWRLRVTAHATSLERFARRLLPLYARALDLPSPDTYFEPFFQSPLLRLRLTRYPRSHHDRNNNETVTYGIHPHVDTSFLTFLVASGPGLVIYHPNRKGWVEVPYIAGQILVNTGELARQWTNDRWVSVPHFVDSSFAGSSQHQYRQGENTENEIDPAMTTGYDRYAVPCFVSPTADQVMTCLPTCCNNDNPPRYPPFSYESSQAVAQGE